MSTDLIYQNTDNTELGCGRAFVYAAGKAVLICPAPDTTPEQRVWVVVNVTTGTITEMVIGEPSWVDAVPLTELVTRLATGWTGEQAHRQSLEVKLATSQGVIEDIRTYAVDQHQSGRICREGLEEFLEHFALEPYRPRYSVQVSVVARMELDADSADEAERRARYLVDGIEISGQSDDEETVVETLSITVDTAQAL